jgi:lipopolysaccharide transport system ATP-binding protein
LNKMQDVGRQGRTVLFVSHNMPAITRLCERTILLDAGQIVEDGPSSQVVSAYLSSGLGTTAAREWPNRLIAPGNDLVRLRAVRVRTQDGQVADAVDIRQPVGIEIEYEVLQSDHILLPYYSVFNQEGVKVFAAIDQDPDWRGRPRLPGRYVSTSWIPGNLLSEGMFFIGAAIRDPRPKVWHVHEREAVGFQVIDSLDGDSARGDFTGHMAGAIRPLLQWDTQFTADGSNVTDAEVVEVAYSQGR